MSNSNDIHVKLKKKRLPNAKDIGLLDSELNFNKLSPPHIYCKCKIKATQRIANLSQINQNWFGGEYGKPVNIIAKKYALKFVENNPNLADLFHIYLTEDGGISFELDRDGWLFVAEFCPNGVIEIDGASIDGKVYEMKTFQANDCDINLEFNKMLQETLNGKG